LKHEIFNLPLRRDIVHNVMIWRKKLFKKTTHVTRTKGTTAGSGVKPFKQKGTGRAR
jgi:large subunit ribosomal protein L4